MNTKTTKTEAEIQAELAQIEADFTALLIRGAKALAEKGR